MANLQKEVDEVQKETAATLTRAEKAELKEQAANKQEEELTPRVQALVNSLTGKSLFLSFLFKFLDTYHN